MPKRNIENHVYFGYAITIKEDSPFKRAELVEFLESKKGSILSLPYADNSVYSMSCLHVVEHIGFGRIFWY